MKRVLGGPSHLYEHCGSYVFRRRIPQKIRPIFGQSEWLERLGRIGEVRKGRIFELASQKILRTDKQIERAKRKLAQHEDTRNQIAALDFTISDAEEAVMEVASLIKKLEDHGIEPEPLRARVASTLKEAFDGTSVPISVAAPSTPSTPETNTGEFLLSAVADFCRDNHKIAAQGHRDTAVKLWTEHVGDIDIRHIEPRHIKAFVDAERLRGVKDDTIRRRTGALSEMALRSLRYHRIHIENPFAYAAELAKIKRDQGAKASFKPHQMIAFASFVSSAKISEYDRAVLSLMLNSTCGVSEAAGITYEDIDLDSPEGPFVWIRHNDRRRLKNDKRVRRMPLVGDALEYVDGLTQGAFTVDGKKLSTRYNRVYVRKIVPDLVTGQSKGNQSLNCTRHTAKMALHDAGASGHHVNYLMGHSRGSGASALYFDEHPPLERYRELLESATASWRA